MAELFTAFAFIGAFTVGWFSTRAILRIFREAMKDD